MKKPSDHDLAAPLMANLLDLWPIERWCDRKTIVAVSGGPDSVALLRLLHQILEQHGHSPDQRLTVAHFNHQTRGQASKDEQCFVQSLSKKLSLPFVAGSVAKAVSAPDSEESLRNQRYDFLAQTGRAAGASYIATGHHQDDQVETVLFRALRGTGVTGLAGIPAFRPIDPQLTIARPLIRLPRVSLDHWLHSIQQSYCRDASNQSDTYARNYLRNQTLPDLRERFGDHIDASIASLAEQAAEFKDYLNAKCEPLMGSFRPADGGLKIDCVQLSQAPRLLIKQCIMRQWSQLGWPLQSMGADKWNQLADWILATPTSRKPSISLGHLPGKIEVFRIEETILLRKT